MADAAATVTALKVLHNMHTPLLAACALGASYERLEI